ncbi:MAG: penicillin-binding protein 1A [Oligoflexia bacterium]
MKLTRAAWIFRSFFFLMVAGTAMAALFGAVIFWIFARDLPEIITISDYRPPVASRILGGNGDENQLLGEFSKERRYVIPYEKMPDIAIKAFIAAEDDSFFQHQGINPASMLRATIANLRAGHVVQGGSTITQQVAKSLLLTPERSFSRKFKEVLLANKIERNLTKEQILYLYLNQIYLGRGSYGIEAAARNYFRKPASELSLAEAAILGGLPQAPGKYSPNLNPRKAKDRQLYVLRRMLDNGFITRDEMSKAAAKPVRIFTEEDINQRFAPYVVEHLRRYLQEKYGERALYEEGLTLKTPLTRELATAATRALQQGLREVDKRAGYRGALRRITTETEREEFLVRGRARLIEKTLGYVMFMPDGQLDPIASLQEAGLATDLDLLKEGDIHEALVTNIDEGRRTIGVMIGVVKLEIAQKDWRWARAVKEGRPVGLEPTSPSQVASKGNVVLVRVSKEKSGAWSASLEQEPVVQGALISLDSRTGAVLAMVGGYDFEKSEFNRAIQAQRQPGSSFKPLIYAAAVEKGYTPASVIIDAPLTFEDKELGKWKPSNFDEKFNGDTTFRQALIKSRNIPTIRLLQNIQVPGMIEYAKRIGFAAELPQDLSISLGSMAASPLEMVRTYALFPRLGRKVQPVFFTELRDRDGKVLEESPLKVSPPTLVAPPAPQNSPIAGEVKEPPSTENTSNTGVTGKMPLVLPSYPQSTDPEQVMDPRVAYVMTHLMTEVVNYGTGTEARQLGRPAAGKTGTTNDYLDAWFIGFTPQVVTGVWVGHDSQQPIGAGETGAKASLPIWLSFMREAVKGYPNEDFTVPDGIVFASIDPSSGKRVTGGVARGIKEAFIEGTEPPEVGPGSMAPSESAGDFLKEDFQ